MEKIKAISLFCSAGIGELRRPEFIDVVASNEILNKRAECYKFFNPTTEVVCGDIKNPLIKDKIVSIAKSEKAKLLIATPPCQGVSTLGKNKKQEQYEQDPRNFLIFDVFDVIDRCDFNYILIENVARFLDMAFPYEKGIKPLEYILRDKYSNNYTIDVRTVNAKDYGVPQSRPRAIIRLWKKNLHWDVPLTEKEITLREAIGDLPSLEAGQSSNIKWHYAKQENPRIVLALQHTEPGHSAIANEFYYPKKEDGTRIRGFHNTFKRMVWDAPCPARTTYCGSMSSHNNVHPGHLREDGTYSDARVLSLLELFIVSSIPEDIDFPPGTPDTFIRTVIGESVPPRLMERFLSKLGKN